MQNHEKGTKRAKAAEFRGRELHKLGGNEGRTPLPGYRKRVRAIPDNLLQVHRNHLFRVAAARFVPRAGGVTIQPESLKSHIAAVARSEHHLGIVLAQTVSGSFGVMVKTKACKVRSQFTAWL